jgi:pyruvate-formate lyase-activating enzyme
VPRYSGKILERTVIDDNWACHLIRFKKQNAGRAIIWTGGYWEIRWELSGSNLGSRFSSARTPSGEGRKDTGIEHSPGEVLGDTSAALAQCDPKRTFIRFLGGEPTLYWEDLLEAFRLFDSDDALRPIPVVVQTNGIDIGTGKVDLTPLSSLRIRFLFELLLKGTNDLEFLVLTGERSALYKEQLKAYAQIRRARQRTSNVALVPVLAYYHTAAKGIAKYYLVNPGTGKPLFDNVEKWDPSFRRLWNSAPVKWADLLKLFPMVKRKDILEGFGPQGAEIIAEDPKGVAVNPGGIFPIRPRPSAYAKSIVDHTYWES